MLSSSSFLIACLTLASPQVRQGALAATANPFDLALCGPGYFMVATEKGVEFTRGGTFRLDASGRVVTRSTGQVVLGWNGSGQLSTLTARMAHDEAHQATSVVSLAGNLNALAGGSGEQGEANFRVYDSLGQPLDVQIVFSDRRTEARNPLGAASSWAWTAYVNSEGGHSDTVYGSSSWPENSRLFFNGQGGALDALRGSLNVMQVPVDGSVRIDFSRIGQMNAESFVQSAGQNGFPPGTLIGNSISPDGTFYGIYSNGLQRSLGQFAVATFRNPNALAPDGRGLFMANRRSGPAAPGIAGEGRRGTVASGYLERL